MSDANQHQSTAQPEKPEWKLEVVQIPVSDVDRAKRFYAEQVGFTVDLDTRISETKRLVQLTPPGSDCSIHLSSGLFDTPPGSVRGMQIVVRDVAAARAELLKRGVEVSSVQHIESGVWVEGPGGRWNSFVLFDDPDGNGWVLQERPS
jgi:catechol 2,3-dioxygenase-like lactoylglutathione lyase family enzyme